MEEQSIKHRQLSHLSIDDIPLEGKRLSIEAGFLQSFVDDLHTYRFVLKERGSERIIPFSASFERTEEQMVLIRGELLLDPHLALFKPYSYWDLYLHSLGKDRHESESDNEGKYTRIKMNLEDIRLHSFFDANELFFPYRTKNGNVSFRKQEPITIGRLEQVDLNEGNILTFSGYSIYASQPESQMEVLGRQLVLTNNTDDEEIRLPLNGENRDDLASLYGQFDFSSAAFNGKLSLEELKRFSTNNYYKFYIETEVQRPEGIEYIRSPRLDYFPRNPMNQYHFSSFKSENKTWRIRVKPTKNSRYLTVRISQYSSMRETARRIKNFLSRVKSGRIVKRTYKLVFSFLGKLPPKKKQVVFESFLGKQYSCNPRAIYEYMLEHHPEYDMYWSIDPRSAAVFEGKGLKTINRFSIPWLFIMSRSKYWVSNSRLPIWIPKPSHTTYLQTWHGTPLKRLAADMDEVHMPGTNTAKYKKNFLLESSRWDYLISPNRYSSEIFTRAFGFEKDMIESGYPRNDFLHNANNAETMNSLKERLDLPLDKKVILYAPTWRDNEFYAKGKYKFNLKLELDKMQEELGDEYIVLLRMHYLIAENLDITPFAGFAYDVSHHTDISELYLISDLLITDYSSVFFDYANLGRPMIFYVYDIENYRDTLRGFYFDFEAQAPGPLVKTTEDVIRHIQHPDPTSQANFDAFYQKFCYLEDGEASKRVVEKVFKTK
ncbi:hypothetical protein ASG66_15370 [Bacillus sp. Leaf406]|nr:hypothetical protein ASG66_15370 [Bacillus sp. Leaf406]